MKSGMDPAIQMAQRRGNSARSRILAAVDCLDALASDRQYRKAMPMDKAMAIVMAESGKSFDPRVVEELSANIATNWKA